MHRTLSYVLLAVLAVLGTGCAQRRPAKTASTPPAPAARPPATPEPLSIPQTQVKLPPAQPVDPAALVTADERPTAEVPEPSATRVRSRAPAARPPARVEAPAPASAPAAVRAPEPERPLVLEQISAAEQRRLHDTMAAHRREIGQILDQATARGPNPNERALIVRIRATLDQATKAAAGFDLRQADALVERALLLSRELASAR